MALRSWVASANDEVSDFPIQNLPYGVFRHRERTRIGVAIGDQILDLHACASHGLLAPLSEEIIAACGTQLLNPLMALVSASWSALRRYLAARMRNAAADVPDRGGGAGIALVLAWSRDLDYRTDQGRNRLTLSVPIVDRRF